MAGVNDETFRLLLDGFEVPIVSNYSVSNGIMEVPAVFEMTVGHSGLTAELWDLFPPYTPFELFVGDVRVQRGELDSFTPVGGEGTEVVLRGRDLTKWLVDKQLRSERTFSEKTFLQLTELALDDVGLTDRSIQFDNTANRKAITGVQSVKELAPVTTEGAETEAGTTDANRKVIYRTIKGEIGTTWFDFLRTQYQRAGLFLWADVIGGFVLSRPNGQQAPLYRILRRKNGENAPGDVTVVGQPSFSWDSTKRYTECLVTGRSGGGKDGRGTIVGRAFDPEMIELLNPEEADRADGGKRTKELIINDKTVRTVQQAEFLARRKIAESRRTGWKLSYTVAGHTAPAITGGGMAVWQPDTVVHVVDDQLGIDGPMYIESCDYRRLPHTLTQLNLMRIEDLVFATEDLDNPPKLARRKGVANVRVGKTKAFRVESMWRRNPQWGGLPTQVRDKTTLRPLK
jgi:prophage tail gpP-like protein